MKRVIPSIPDFRDFILKDNYFVDKTMFIKDWFDGNAYVALMPRPKRFGKTLNLSMIEHFFDIRKPENGDLFSEFKIAKDKEFCEAHQNKYPVISLTLKEVKDANWEECLNSFAHVMSVLYRQHKYLLQSDKLDDFDKEIFSLVMHKQASFADLKYSLKALSEYLYTHFGRKVIILVDEYDTPITNAFKKTRKPIKSPDESKPIYYQNVVEFIQMFMGYAYKDNVYMERGLITGVMRISRESLFSTWNNVSVFDILSPYFTDSFGFTEDEIDKLLSDSGLQDKKAEVKHWYDGYQFGDKQNIYNPWSIINYIAYNKAGFKPYWINSSDYTLIQDRITEPSVKQTIEALIKGETIQKTIVDNFVFENFESRNSLIWTLLFYSGFLTKVKAAGNNNLYELRIPNNEVKILFADIILKWIEDAYRITKDEFVSVFNSLIINDLQGFEKGLRAIMQDSLSYFDKTVSNKSKNENIFHVYTLGLLAILSHDYQIKSNRESGEGRYDIMLIPCDKKLNGIIIEIKSIEHRREDENEQEFAVRVNSEIDKALKQIDNKEYDKELIINKITEENIIKVPIVFAGKTPFVNKLETKN